MMSLSRRSLIAAGAAGLAGLGAARAGQAASQPFFARTGLPIGLQLYTLADQAKADLEGTLKAVAAIGFKSIELAGYAGRTPAQLRKAMDAVGLSTPSAHVQVQAQGGESSLDGDLSRLADEAHVLGVRMIVMPIFYTPERFDLKPRAGEAFGQVLGRIGGAMTADDWKFNADFLNAKGAVLKTVRPEAGLSQPQRRVLAAGGRQARRAQRLRDPAGQHRPRARRFRDGRRLGGRGRPGPLRAAEGSPGTVRGHARQGHQGDDQTQLRLRAGSHRGGLRQDRLDRDCCPPPTRPASATSSSSRSRPSPIRAWSRSGSVSTICRSCGPESSQVRAPEACPRIGGASSPARGARPRSR
jgi:hypothetical protein